MTPRTASKDNKAEGCVCGHGQYNHGSGAGFIGRILGYSSRCIRCNCMEFRRP